MGAAFGTRNEMLNDQVGRASAIGATVVKLSKAFGNCVGVEANGVIATVLGFAFAIALAFMPSERRVAHVSKGPVVGRPLDYVLAPVFRALPPML